MSGDTDQPFETSDHPQEAEVTVAELVHKRTFFLDESRRLRTAWRFLIFGASFVVLEIAVGLVAGIVLLVVLLASGEPDWLGDPQQLEQNLAGVIEEWTPVLLTVVAAPLTAMTFGLLFVCRKYLDRRSLTSTGFVRRRMVASLLAGTITGLTVITAASAIVIGVGGIRFEGVGFSIMAAMMIPTLVLMAFMEEIVFRSYLLQNLVDIDRPVFGVLFTSVVFWIAHALNSHFWSSALIPLNMFGAGVVLSLAYLVSKDIWFPTGLHFGWNAAQGPLLGLPVSGMKLDGFVQLHAEENAPAWVTGAEFGLEASAAVTIVNVVLIAGFLFALRRSSPEVPP